MQDSLFTLDFALPRDLLKDRGSYGMVTSRSFFERVCAEAFGGWNARSKEAIITWRVVVTSRDTPGLLEGEVGGKREGWERGAKRGIEGARRRKRRL